MPKHVRWSPCQPGNDMNPNARPLSYMQLCRGGPTPAPKPLLRKPEDNLAFHDFDALGGIRKKPTRRRYGT